MFASTLLTRYSTSSFASSHISRSAGTVLFLLVVASIAFQPHAAAQSSAAIPVAAVKPAAADPASPHGLIKYLWPAGVPGAVGTEEQDKPHLEIFGASGPGPHTAVIVCPGGGYHYLEDQKEGSRVAEWLNLRGITAFVLTYRLLPRYSVSAPMLDGYRAVRWVRSHAEEFAIAPDRIGMWGFSAGGHMVGMVGTHFDDGNPQAADPIDRVSDRPDFVVSSYGALSMQPGVAKPSENVRLFGDHSSPELRDNNSPDIHVTPRTPPFFLYANLKDEKVPVLSSVAFYTALVRSGVPAEIHLFQEGTHGTGLAQGYLTLSAWPGLLENWLRLNGWIPPVTASPVH